MADNKGDAATAVTDETEQTPEIPAGNEKSASAEGNGDVASVGDGGDSEAKQPKQESEEKDVGDGGDSGAKQPKQEPEEKSVPLHARIVKQVEFYFGDYNLSRDRFLKEQVQLDDGWISSEIMLKFNRLKNICGDWDVIVEALKDYSDLVQISADGTKVRRNPSRPLPGDSKERRDEIQSRTIYANRFPLDTKLDDLMDFFDSYGPVEHIFMKRDFHKHTFKGSVFVTYKTKADAEEFLREEGTKFKDAPLEVKQWKADYFKSKSSKKDKSSKNNSGSKHEENNAKDSRARVDEVDADDEERVRQQMTKNAVLHISGMNQETEREDVREFFLKHGDVSWVDFDRGVTEGYIRLKEPNGAFSTLESLNKLEGGVVINGAIVHVRVVEGDEELQYWQKMYRDIAERKQLKKEGLLKHRAGAKYKARLSRMQNQKRGRRHDRYFDAPPSKVSRGNY